MGRISENPVSVWKEKIDWFMYSTQCRELDRIDGEPMEFGWTNFPGFTTLQILAEIQDDDWYSVWTWAISRTDYLVSMWKDIEWGEKGNEELCIVNSLNVGTLVVSWAWIRKEMVRNSYVQTEWKMGSSRWGHDAQLQWKRTPRIPRIQRFGARRFETLLWRRHNRWSGSSDDHLRQSAQYLRSSSGHVRRSGLQNLWLLRAYRETCCSGQSRNYRYSNGIDDNEQITSDRWQRARKLAAQWRAKVRKSSRTSSIDQTMLQCRYHEDRGEGTVLHDPQRCRIGQIVRLMSREKNFTSRQRSIQSERVDPWEHWDRSSFGGGSQASSRPSRNRDHDRIPIWWWNLFMGNDREWNKQRGDDGGHPGRPHRSHWRVYRETRCQCKTDTNTKNRRLLLQRLRCYIICVFGLTWNQARTTRVVSKCQKRWSDCFDTILQYFEKKTEQSNSESWHRCFVQNLRLLSIGQFEHGWIICKEEEDLKRDFSVVWTHSMPIPSCTFEQFKATLEENTSILHCRTTCCYRATSPSASTTLEAPTMRTRSFNLDWFRVATTSRKGGMRCSSRPWIQSTSVIIERRITTWRSPGLQCTNTIGKYTKNTVYLCN